jgi:hypothetical protein
MKRTIIAGGVLLLGVAIALAQQSNISDEGGRVLALEQAWNHALEEKAELRPGEFIRALGG